ncbi:MAG: IclR family transcriptional regulator [Betaproteobacteria bacterium]|nr:IclR family transcriptional regulator [Betaproteobacteria bacterium]
MRLPDPLVRQDSAEKDPQFAYTLARGLEVLRAFDAESTELGNREISGRVGIPRSTVARLTRTLEMLGYLHYDSATSRYRLTTAMLCLAHPVLARLAIRRIARPHMQQLADYAHGSVSLGSRLGLDIVLVSSCIDINSITARPEIGARWPIGDTALGVAYLAACGEAQRNVLLNGIAAGGRVDMKSLRPLLRAELDRFSKHGFCLVRDRARRGMHAVSAPVRNTDGEIMVLNCTIAAFQLAPDSLENDIGPRLVNLAHSIEMGLGIG